MRSSDINVAGEVADFVSGAFLQSAEWEAFQQKLAVRTWRVGERLVLWRELPMGQGWLYVPRSNAKLFDELLSLARKERAIFVRVEPLEELTAPWRKAASHVQPVDTLVLDLTQSEEELLAGMRQKTRYNIRLAEKKGVQVRFSRDEAGLEHFLRLAGEVAGRGPFHFHPDGYYRTMLQVLGEADMVELAVAEHAGEVLAVHMLLSYEGAMTYLHGASSSEKRAFMAPHLLQWESIKRAKVQGLQRYDFWGVAPAEAGSGHRWAGITRFKEGFGGTRVSYPGGYDYVLRPGGYAMLQGSRKVLEIVRKIASFKKAW